MEGERELHERPETHKKRTVREMAAGEGAQ